MARLDLVTILGLSTDDSMYNHSSAIIPYFALQNGNDQVNIPCSFCCVHKGEHTRWFDFHSPAVHLKTRDVRECYTGSVTLPGSLPSHCYVTHKPAVFKLFLPVTKSV